MEALEELMRLKKDEKIVIKECDKGASHIMSKCWPVTINSHQSHITAQLVPFLLKPQNKKLKIALKKHLKTKLSLKMNM